MTLGVRGLNLTKALISVSSVNEPNLVQHSILSRMWSVSSFFVYKFIYLYYIIYRTGIGNNVYTWCTISSQYPHKEN